VGDIAETIASLLPVSAKQQAQNISLADLVEKHILPLAKMNEVQKKQEIIQMWQQLDQENCFIFNKLLTGSFRVGASKQLTTRALAEAFHLPQELVARACLKIQPTSEFYLKFKQKEQFDAETHYPMPFYLASPLETLEELGDPSEWFAEWKWDGIRAQLIFYDGHALVWSRGNESITHQTPEIVQALSSVQNPLF
jgi:DNA ligase-1